VLHGQNDQTFPICWPEKLIFRNPIKSDVEIPPTAEQALVSITLAAMLALHNQRVMG